MANTTSTVRRALRPGVYAPLPTFFDDSQEIDYSSYKKHLLNLATKGMVPVCAGSLGEAVHLSFDERTALIRFIRATLDEAGLVSTPIVAGVGGLSTRETIELARAAAYAGADAGMVILPAYYAASLNTDPSQVIGYYMDICESSPIPLLLYNFPANAGGQDMPSAIISEIMNKAPNLCGVKLTCGGSIAKLVRLNAEIGSNSQINQSRPFPFLLLDGLIADLTPWMHCGGHGTVSGIPNFAPAASMRLWALLNMQSPTTEEVREATKLQAILSKADVAAVPGGIRAMKYALNKMHGYGIAPRKPLLPLRELEGEKFMSALKELLELEAEYAKSDEERPIKVRRTTRACLQCRARKQRCSPSSEAVSLQAPCERCHKHGFTCSFQTDKVLGPDETPGPSLMAQLVVELHQRINQHEARISELERGHQSTASEGLRTPLNRETTSTTKNQDDKKEHDTHSPTDESETNRSNQPDFSIDGIDLGPPIATLRSLTTLAQSEPAPDSNDLRSKTKSKICYNAYDPVARGLLSIDDAQKAVEIFFKHCHPWAPVLDGNMLDHWDDLRHSNPVLFLAICSVGTRFWEMQHAQSSLDGETQERFSKLTALLDEAVSRLLLRPTPSDVSLNSIRVLLLYAQWMPFNWNNEDWQPSKPPISSGLPKSRYNEVSAWAVLGLALRYALFLGLDRSAIAPFQDNSHTPSDNDVCKLRVWYNLLTCDFNLMLTSGLPASLDPTLSAQVVIRFTSSRHSQQPADLRVSALVELVCIVHRAMRSCGDVSGRQLDSYSLGQLNIELEHWERSWLSRLRDTESQHNQLPFTSIRWYRLALNSASLGPLLSPTSQAAARPPVRVSLVQSLEISLTAAAQILFSLSSAGESCVWKLESQNRSSFPEGPFHVDIGAIRRLYYAVDSTWISHTFAVIFIVLCYIRGAIDENLQIRNLNATCTTNSTLIPANSNSIINHLLRLSQDFFDGVCRFTSCHPACDFKSIVQNAALLVLAPPMTELEEGQGIDELALQSLQDLMHDAGMEWPGSLFDMAGEFNPGWEVGGGMFDL